MNLTAYQTNEQQTTTNIAALVNSLFNELAASCPLLLSLNAEQLASLKKQWILAFVENGVTTIERVQYGMKAMRAKNNGYLPSVGEFIAHCKQGELAALGLPSEEEFKYRLEKFRSHGGFAEIDSFEFMSDAEYWLITEMANKAKNRGYTAVEEANAMKKALANMAKKLAAGKTLPPRRKAIPPQVTYLDPQVVKAGWANLKALVDG